MAAGEHLEPLTSPTMPTVGCCIAQDSCADFKSDCTQQREVLATADGGQSFRLITPPGSRSTPCGEISTAPLATLSPAAHNGRKTGDPSGTQISQGEGFDQCQASTVSNMQTWWSDSPYSTTGIYIGGENESVFTAEPELLVG